MKIKFPINWFANTRNIQVFRKAIVQESVKAIAHLEENAAREAFLQILDANIPSKTKTVIDEAGNRQEQLVPAYTITSNLTDKLNDLFETYYAQEHFIYRAKQHFAQFNYDDEEKFDKLNYYLWNNIFLTANTKETVIEFKHWMINTKKAISRNPNNTTKNETIFGLYGANGGTGKSFLLQALSKALTIDEKLITIDADIFGFNSHYLKDSIGVLYKDELGNLIRCKEQLKEIITTQSVLVNEKFETPYRIPKMFSLLISGNKNPGSYLFEDEGDGQRRNAIMQARGRLISCEEIDLINYFKLMFKYCPTIENTREYVKSTSTTNKHNEHYWQMVKAIQHVPAFRKHEPSFMPKHQIRKHIKQNIDVENYYLPENDTYFNQLLDQILSKLEYFKVKEYANCSTKHYKPTAEFLKLKLDETTLIYQDDNVAQLKEPVDKTYTQMVEEALGNTPSSPDPDKSSAKDEAHEITLTVATEPGINSTQLKKANGTVKELANYLKDVATKTEEKTDAYLISNGYSDKEECERKEENFTEINSILLDCDNEQADKDLLKKFNCEYFQLEKVVYQTASSTSEKPKFRVIIPLDEPISLTGNIKMRHIKKAVAEIFKKYTDPKASWFFTPTKDKIETIKYYSGQPYKSWDLIQQANNFTFNDAINNACYENKSQYSNNPEGWRNLPSVKECLDGLVEGERDNKINAACYAISKHFSKVEIREFLSEIPPVGKDFNSVIAKFKKQYCC